MSRNSIKDGQLEQDNGLEDYSVASIFAASLTLAHQCLGYPSLNETHLMIPSFSKVSSFECQIVNNVCY